jgi:hypothetical protein
MTCAKRPVFNESALASVEKVAMRVLPFVMSSLSGSDIDSKLSATSDKYSGSSTTEKKNVS